MTDHPRFQRMDAELGHLHRQYHGAIVVDLVFRLADWWIKRGRRQHGASLQRYAPTRAWPRIATLAAAAILLSGTTQTYAQETVRVRGAIEEVAGGVYSIRTRDDKVVRLKLATNASVATSVRSSLADIRPGLYVGIAAVPQADSGLRALEAHIFDESMPGTGEGHRAWDLLPNSTMTNAVVLEIVSAVGGHAITLRFKDGQQGSKFPRRRPSSATSPAA